MCCQSNFFFFKYIYVPFTAYHFNLSISEWWYEMKIVALCLCCFQISQTIYIYKYIAHFSRYYACNIQSNWSICTFSLFNPLLFSVFVLQLMCHCCVSEERTLKRKREISILKLPICGWSFRVVGRNKIDLLQLNINEIFRPVIVVIFTQFVYLSGFFFALFFLLNST